MSIEKLDLSICRRLAELRRSVAGDRGQSRFAAQLGLTPSTYANYEKTRVPPPGLLVRAAELAGADLVWLLTGRPASPAPGGPANWAGNAQHKAMLQRVAKLLDDRPANVPAMAAFLDLLAEKTLLEQSLQIVANSSQLVSSGGTGGLSARWKDTGGQAASGTQPVNPPPAPFPDFGRWIPIFGRAAAGLARFWKELGEHGTGSSADQPSAIDELISRAAELSDADSRLAVFEPPSATGSGRGRADRGRGRVGSPGSQRPSSRVGRLRVRLVQLSEPLTDYQLTEFLESEELSDRYRPLFGLRLAGDSMAPMFADGTIVLCSPSEPARPGGPAVVRLAGQIGLTCKIYRPREAMVRLVSANDKYPPQEFPARQLEWALAVLGSVKLD